MDDGSVSGDRDEEFLKFYKQTLDIADNEDNHNELSMDFPRTLHSNLDKFQYYTVEKFNNSFKTQTINQLSTISINIRGLSCNYINLIQYLKSLKIEFDALILTECHIQMNELFDEDLHKTHPIEGYDKFYVKSTIRYGGVVMYVKSEYKATYYQELTKSCETHDSVYVKIDPANLHTKSKAKNILYLGGYYRYCEAADKIQFIDKINSDLGNKNLQKNDIIIAGDFNICLMKSTHKADSLFFLNTILGNTCEILIFKPTRIQYCKNSLQVKSASLIDQIITNMFEYECTSGNLQYADSDHYATFAIFTSYKDDPPSVTSDIYRRNLNKVDEDKLLNDFNNGYNWEDLIFNEPNLDNATENLNNCITELCNKHAPLEKLSNRHKKHNNKPWIDNELTAIIRLKNIAHARKTSTPTAINKSNSDKLRNIVTAKTRENRKKYFADYFHRFKSNSRKLWDGINMALEQTRRKKSIPSTIKDVDGKPVEGDQNIANAFAKYFKSVPSKTKKNIAPYKHPYLHYLNKSKSTDRYLELTETNADEVYKHIIKLKDNCSPGPIPVPNAFLKIIGKPISQLLSCIINRSMTSGHVPSIMKIGKQTPVHKGGELCVKNFRPITVCSSISKILEKIVRDRVMEYLKHIKILNKCQFGFRNNHSTNHATINLAEITLDGLERGLKSGTVFLDVAKAFDTVNHRYLLRKLEHYGFRGTTLMWMESYLTNRSQYVNIRNHKSGLYKLDWGIPQGGILAPILFILFMNDIVHSSEIFNFSIYADDTCLILGMETNEYDEAMKNELVKIVDWFSSNELVLNLSKTDYLNFGPHYNKCYEKGEYDLTELHSALPQFLFEDCFAEPGDPNHIEVNKKGEFILHELSKVCPNIYLKESIIMPDGSYIPEPDSVKYLGVHFDNKFNFKRHIDIICCKINRIVGILWKGEHLNVEAKKMIYHSLVESHLNYAIVTWASSFSKNLSELSSSEHIPEGLKSIQSVQNKVIRAIFRKPRFNKSLQMYTSNTPLFKELKVLKLFDLYCFNLASLAHEFYYEKNLPDKIAENFTKTSDISSRNTRNCEYSLYYKTPKLVSTLRKPSIAATNVWNSLPLNIRQLKSKLNFKSKLKEFYLEKYKKPS